LVYASPDPHSDGSEDTQATITAPSLTRQAEARAAYIESILADWPAPTPKQERTIGSLLGNGTTVLTVADWQTWEIKRHIDATESPGIHGTFGSEVAA
jgi:hypothetical protein